MAVSSPPVSGSLNPHPVENVDPGVLAPAPEREPRVAQARLDAGWWTAASLAVGDVLALTLALVLVGGEGALAVAYVPVAVLCLAVSGGYRNRMSLRALDSAPWIASRLAIPLLVFAPAAVFLGGDLTALLTVALISVGVVVPVRGIGYALLRRARRSGRLLVPTVILGAGEVGAELGRAFGEYPEYGVAPVGFLDCVSGNLPYPVLGDVDRLDWLLGLGDIRRVVVAFGPARESELVAVLRTAVAHAADVHIVPRFFDCGVAPQGPDTDDVRGIPLYRVRRAALRAPAWYMKRLVDVVVSGTALVVLSPLLALLAVAVKATSAGPVFFRQRRVGQAGREIEVPKFRSLRVNHDSETQWNVDEDPRLTAVGRILRRTSMDELPQLWSVLKGDMSLVGPRPERPFFVRRFTTDIDGYGDRHRVPVGLTGWAQVHGLRGDTSIEERARFDNQYIEHWSMWRDIVVLLRTVAEVARGARR